MLSLDEILRKAVEDCASDLFIMAGLPVRYKANGGMKNITDEKNTPQTAEDYIREIYEMADRTMRKLEETGDDDFSFTKKELSRFRISVYRQRGSLAAVVRIIPFGIPDYREMHIPEYIMDIANQNKGLVLVTGPAGSGKSTTLACIIDRINQQREGHIITLEEPIEFLHRNARCAVSQREIGLDTESYLSGLKASLRQAPDVILLGEMRDYETIRTAMTAAETGHLVIGTLHTIGAASTIDRIIDVFPSNQQQQIRVQLAMVLQTVVSQQLIPTVDGTQMPVFEIMRMNNATRNMVREAKIHQLDALIASSGAEGMVTMDAALLELAKQKKIAPDTAVKYAVNTEMMEKRMALL